MELGQMMGQRRPRRPALVLLLMFCEFDGFVADVDLALVPTAGRGGEDAQHAPDDADGPRFSAGRDAPPHG